MAGLLSVALVALVAAAESGPRPADATLLFFNDAHEIAPIDSGKRAGAARLRTLVQKARAENPNTLVLFGGDLAGGTLFGEFRGEPSVEALSRIGVDVANFGKHDFDFGAEQTRRLISLSRFQWLTSNLREASGGPFAGLPDSIVRVVGKVRVGLLSVTTELYTTNAHPDVVERDPIASAAEQAAGLKRRGVDLVIALTQQRLADDLALAEAVPGIDLILGDEASETETVIRTVGGTTIVKAAGNMSELVRVDVHLDAAPRLRPHTLALDRRVAEEAGLAAFVRTWMDALDARLSQVVTVVPFALDATVSRNRSEETALGNLLADAFRAAFDADVALLNGGGVRSDKVFPAGPLTLRALSEILPFGDQIVLLELDGATLRDVLEHGLSAPGSGRFPHVSGLTLRYDPRRPAGQRLVEVTLAGRPLTADARVRLATRAFLADGGDGYVMLRTARVLVPAAQGFRDTVAVTRYLMSSGSPRPTAEKRVVRQ